MKNLEEIMKKEGWKLKCYWNCGVPYLSWHKNGIQIDDRAIEEIDATKEWEDA